jgi:hypothetical protein
VVNGAPRNGHWAPPRAEKSFVAIDTAGAPATTSPSGFRRSDATFATNLFDARPADAVSAVCTSVIERFDARVRDLYNPEDAEAGYLEVENRQGDIQRFPLVTIALGVATNERRSYTDPREIVEVAREMNAFLKQARHRSGYAVDERSSDASVATGHA